MKWVIVTTHFETMGLIAYEKMVDIHFVANLLGARAHRNHALAIPF
jgi:hypothetical protein